MVQKLLLAGMLAAAMAWAQGGGGMEGMGGGMGGGGGRQRGGMQGMETGGMPRQRLSRTDQIADKLKLNKEQKEQLQPILSAAREKATPLTAELFKHRAEIAGAMINGRPGEEVQKLMADYTASAAQLAGVEAEAFGKIYAILKPNQQKNAGQAFELLAGMFSAPARGGQGRGRGGAR